MSYRIGIRMVLLLLATQASLLAVDEPILPAARSIIPKPLEVQVMPGAFRLDAETAIRVGSPGLMPVGQYLARLVAPATGLKLPVGASSTKPKCIALELDVSRKDLGDEAYKLVCATNGITITAAGPAGVFYGVQTLRQLLPVEIEHRTEMKGVEWTVPCISIVDRPRFKWRGYLLDPARHFRTKEEVKRYIDLLALQKLNILHLHLTDNQGWRIEIKRYPKLTEVGARLANASRQKDEGWFYSQADIREIVAYAASRFVTVVPEVEMPGHSLAATKSYPSLGCGGKASDSLCVSAQATFEFATNVLNEVVGLFPSRYIHVGADEVRPEPWRACPTCQPLMEKLAGEKLSEGVTPFRMTVTNGAGRPFHEDIGRLQGEFIRRIAHHLATQGRRMVGWDEILDGGLTASSPAVVMAWRSRAAIVGAIGQKRDVVATLFPEYYLDRPAISLERTYAFEPFPANLPSGQEQYLLGVQGNMWGERTPTIQQVDEWSFPRLCAIAETGWTPREARNFADFSGRLAVFCKRLDILGVNYRKPAGSQPGKGKGGQPLGHLSTRK